MSILKGENIKPDITHKKVKENNNYILIWKLVIQDLRNLDDKILDEYYTKKITKL